MISFQVDIQMCWRIQGDVIPSAIKGFHLGHCFQSSHSYPTNQVILWSQVKATSCVMEHWTPQLGNGEVRGSDDDREH